MSSETKTPKFNKKCVFGIASKIALANLDGMAANAHILQWVSNICFGMQIFQSGCVRDLCRPTYNGIGTPYREKSWICQGLKGKADIQTSWPSKYVHCTHLNALHSVVSFDRNNQ